MLLLVCCVRLCFVFIFECVLSVWCVLEDIVLCVREAFCSIVFWKQISSCSIVTCVRCAHFLFEIGFRIIVL